MREPRDLRGPIWAKSVASIARETRFEILREAEPSGDRGGRTRCLTAAGGLLPVFRSSRLLTFATFKLGEQS